MNASLFFVGGRLAITHVEHLCRAPKNWEPQKILKKTFTFAQKFMWYS